MNFKSKILNAFLVAGLVVGCGAGETNDVLEPSQVVESTSVCGGSGAGESNGNQKYLVYPRLDSIGPSSNEVVVSGQYIWVVESGSNTIRRINKNSGKADANFIDLGNDRNPYQIFVDEEKSEIFVANFGKNTLSVADLSSGKIIAEIAHESLKNPSDVTVTSKYIYVTNVNYLGSSQGYGPGSITILDRKTREVLGNLPTAHKNPQYITQFETIDGPRIAISNGGALRFGKNGVFMESEGSLELWSEQEDPLKPMIDVYAIGQLENPTTGAPGRAQITSDGRSVYAVSGISPAIFKLDLEEKRWVNAAKNPHKLYDFGGNATHSAVMAANDLLYITSFNHDALYIFDTACDEKLMGPVDLGTTGNMLEGPQSIALDSQSEFTDVYFLMSISNVLGKVTVQPKN